MCEKCDGHLIEDHLRPLLGKNITTKRNLSLKVEGLEVSGRLWGQASVIRFFYNVDVLFRRLNNLGS